MTKQKNKVLALLLSFLMIMQLFSVSAAADTQPDGTAAQGTEQQTEAEEFSDAEQQTEAEASSDAETTAEISVAFDKSAYEADETATATITVKNATFDTFALNLGFDATQASYTETLLADGLTPVENGVQEDGSLLISGSSLDGALTAGAEGIQVATVTFQVLKACLPELTIAQSQASLMEGNSNALLLDGQYQTSVASVEDNTVEEETSPLAVKINGVEKNVTVLETETVYGGQTWTDAEVTFAYEELSAGTNLIYMRGTAEGATLIASTSYTSSKGFQNSWKAEDVTAAQVWYRGSTSLKNLNPQAQSQTIYVSCNLPDQTMSYYRLKVKQAAQVGTALLVNSQMGYSESTPGAYSTYDNTTGYFSGTSGFGTMSYDNLIIYENGKTVSGTETAPAYSTDTSSFAYKVTQDSGMTQTQVYLARPGRYWVAGSKEYNGTTYTGYVPVIAALNLTSAKAYISQAETLMADADYANMPEALRTMLENAKANMTAGLDDCSKSLYLDTEGKATTTNTGVAYYDRFGKQMNGARLLENDACVIADLAVIAATWKTDPDLANAQLAAYQSIQTIDVEGIQDITAYRDKLIEVKNAKWTLIHTTTTDEVNKVATDLGLPAVVTTSLVKSLKETQTGQEITFDSNGEATLKMGTDLYRVYLAAQGDEVTSDLSLTYSFTSTAGKASTTKVKGTASASLTSAIASRSSVGNDVTLTAVKGEETQTYTLHIVRESTLVSLTAADADGSSLTLSPTFSARTGEYTVTTISDKINLTAKYASSAVEGVTYLFNDTASTDGTYTADLQVGQNTIVVKSSDGSPYQAAYTLKVNRVAAVELTVQTTPSDALFALYDGTTNARVWPTDGKYSLVPGQEYSYTLTCTGYVGQSGKLTLDQSETKTFTLEKAAESEALPQLSADYPGFRSGKDNQSVLNTKTPVTKNSIQVKWERQMGDYVSPTSGTTPIIVDNKIYTVSGSTIYMLDKETGEVLKSATAATSAGFALIPPTYGDGMLFVPLSSGNIQCFNASTLESLWIYKDALGGQCNSDIRYDNGYLYVGFFASKANFVCLNTTDEDPSNTLEEKVPVWTNSSLGSFYWDGAWSNDNYVFVTTNGGHLVCMSKATGQVMQNIDIGAQTRSNISYYNNRIYFTTQGGSLCSYNLTKEGTIDTENIIEPLTVGVQSTSTPVIYNNRAYVGFSNGSNFGTEAYGIMVVDINSDTGALTKAYTVPTDGYPQTSGTLTTAYEAETGYVYVYFTTNSAKGNLYLVKDKAGMTEADSESGLFYTPNHVQYCIASVVADNEGNLYLKNDSAWQFVLTTADVYLKDVQVKNGNGIVDGGEGFDGSRSSHIIQVDAGTTSVDLELTPSEGASVKINGVAGNSQTIQLTDSGAIAEVEVSKGDTVRTYSLSLVAGPALKSLEVVDDQNRGSKMITCTMDPEFAAAGSEYVAQYDGSKRYAYVFYSTLNSTDVVTATVVDGVKDYVAGETIKIKTRYDGSTYFGIPYAGDTDTSAEVTIKVSNAEGTQSKEYRLVVSKGAGYPILTLAENALTERTDSTAKIAVSANKEGELYYLVQGSDQAAPDAAKIQSDGQKVTAAAGENTLELANLTKAEQTVYMVLKDSNGKVSTIRSLTLPNVYLLGDLNDDGQITNADVAQLLSIVTSGGSVDLAIADINGDGQITNADVAQLLAQVTQG